MKRLEDNKKYVFIACGLLIALLLLGSGMSFLVIQDYKESQEEPTVIVTNHGGQKNNHTTANVYSATSTIENDILDDVDFNEDEIDPDLMENFLTVTVSSTKLVKSSSTAPSKVSTKSRTLNDEEIINMSENECWKYLTLGMITSYPDGPFSDYVNVLNAIKARNAATINVKCWYWKNPSNPTDMEKITATKSFVVNASLKQIFEHVFEDIYNDPSKPVINIGDYGMGTWVIRGKNHNPSRRMSTHSLGSCIDINPGTGSFKVNGIWYGNGYGQQAMSKELWKELPECHNKYHVLYADCPIVSIFKAYGFVWGGDWSSTKDCMHLSFIGEGNNTRVQGQENYRKYRR